MRAYLKPNTAKRALLQTWLSKTFNVLDINVYLLQGPPCLGLKKKFQNHGFQKGGKRCSEIGFYK